MRPSDSAPSTASPPRRRCWLDRPATFALSLLLGLGILAGNAWTNWNSIEALTATTLTQALPEIDPSSPTGYADGMRRVIMPQGLDGYHWIMIAQRMASEGKWRIREVDYDNFPAGRAFHWSHLFAWWVVAMGSITAANTGLPLGAAIESAAVWAPLPLHALFLAGIPLAIRKSFGWVAAALLTLGMATVYTFASYFSVGMPDHHGLAAASLLCCALFIALGGVGWTSSPSDQGAQDGAEATDSPRAANARIWFIASGIAGAIGMWISSATTIPVFVGLGLGILASVFCAPAAAGENLRYEPTLWRAWGWSAALASLFFYLLEYAPNHFGWRLEVNHPLYSLALAGAGELLFRITRWRFARLSIARGATEWVSLAAAAIALVLPAALIIAFGTAVFVVKDPFLWALHGNYILEFKPLLPWLQSQSPAARVLFLNPLCLLVFAVLRLVFSRKISARWKAALLVPSVAACFVTVLGFAQNRWMSIADTLWLATFAVVAGCVTRALNRPQFPEWQEALAAGFVAVMVLPMSQLVIRGVRGVGKPPVIGSGEYHAILARDLAYQLRMLSGQDIPVVASAPTTTTWMMYFGGMRGLGTLYWENTEGLKAAARLYSARSEEEAVRLIQQHQVSHIVILLSYEPFLREFPALMGIPPDDPGQEPLLARMAAGRSSPQWARKMTDDRGTLISVPENPGPAPIWAQGDPAPISGEQSPARALIYDVRRARDARKKM
jgi:hypothetical protein